MVSKSSTFQKGKIRGKRKIWQVMVGEVVYIVKIRFFYMKNYVYVFVYNKKDIKTINRYLK